MSDSSIVNEGLPPPQPNAFKPTMIGACLPGAPLYSSGDGEVSPARANALGTTRVVSIALIPADTGEHATSRTLGLVVLTEDQWSAVLETGDTLIPNEEYYVSRLHAGKLCDATGLLTGNYKASVGIATSTTALLVRIPLATLIP